MQRDVNEVGWGSAIMPFQFMGLKCSFPLQLLIRSVFFWSYPQPNGAVQAFPIPPASLRVWAPARCWNEMCRVGFSVQDGRLKEVEQIESKDKLQVRMLFSLMVQVWWSSLYLSKKKMRRQVIAIHSESYLQLQNLPRRDERKACVKTCWRAQGRWWCIWKWPKLANTFGYSNFFVLFWKARALSSEVAFVLSRDVYVWKILLRNYGLDRCRNSVALVLVTWDLQAAADGKAYFSGIALNGRFCPIKHVQIALE